MNFYIDCVPCMVRQTVDAVRLVTDRADVQAAALKDVLSALMEVDYGKPAPVMARRVHRIIRSHVKQSDPYWKIKQISNAEALELYPELKRRVSESADPFETAVRLAIAGNIIDYGVNNNLDNQTIGRTIGDALSADISSEELSLLSESVAQAKSILYLADNAGEIVFDRMLIEQMPLEKITLAVRGAPTINDATLADAEAAGLTGLVPVIDNGTDIPGTVLEECSPAFKETFANADLVISKGQGNLETLHGVNKNICFLLLVKCPLIARELDRSVGTMVIHSTQGITNMEEVRCNA